jgi:hypothetical protein
MALCMKRCTEQKDITGSDNLHREKIENIEQYHQNIKKE